MFELKVNDTTFKVKFGYRAIAETDALSIVDKITENFHNLESENGKLSVMKDSSKYVAELLLIGLGKYHKEFTVNSSSEKEEKLSMVYDLLDDYFDYDESSSLVTVSNAIIEDLVNEGFLFREKTNKAKAK